MRGWRLRGKLDADWNPDDLDGPDDPEKCFPSARSFEERIAPFLRGLAVARRRDQRQSVFKQ